MIASLTGLLYIDAPDKEDPSTRVRTARAERRRRHVTVLKLCQGLYQGGNDGNNALTELKLSARDGSLAGKQQEESSSKPTARRRRRRRSVDSFFDITY